MGKEHVCNKDLVLTPEQEIRRLRKIIEEKNRCIEGFKKYDAERKVYYSRFMANYKLIEEEFERFVTAVGAETNATVERQVSCLLKNWRGSKYGEKYNHAMGKIESAIVKFEKLEKQLDSLLFVPSTNREEYKGIVDSIFLTIKKIKKTLKDGEKC